MDKFEEQDRRDRAKMTLAAKLGDKFLDMRPELRAVMGGFIKEHRLEYVVEKNGVKFINDSLATNVNSLWFALEETPWPIILIMGGVDKGNDYSVVYDLIKHKVKQLILLGEADRIIEWFTVAEIDMRAVNSMDEAVQYAFAFAKKGDTILLSPACASFDLFENYEDRGRQFKDAIRRL